MEAMLKYTDNEMWTSKQYHLKCQNELGFEKAPEYLKWLKEKYPWLEPHHILGATSKRLKFTDYLVIPVTREEHKKAHENLPLFFMVNLPKSLKILIEYIQFLENGRNKYG
jgi:hypothetical protein